MRPSAFLSIIACVLVFLSSHVVMLCYDVHLYTGAISCVQVDVIRDPQVRVPAGLEPAPVSIRGKQVTGRSGSVTRRFSHGSTRGDLQVDPYPCHALKTCHTPCAATHPEPEIHSRTRSCSSRYQTGEHCHDAMASTADI